MATKQPQLCSGLGQFHSPNNSQKPKDYITITFDEITRMLPNPPKVEKKDAQWVIPSTVPSRVHKEQRQNGQFHFLWGDIDKTNGVTFDGIVKSVAGVSDLIAYTSSSATEVKQKSRIIVPLSKPVNGQQYVMLQKILNDKLEAAGIEPDRATERAGQICYLPNRGSFYKHAINRNGGPLNPHAWRNEIQAEKDRIKAAEKAVQRKREEARAKAQRRMESGVESPVDAYNQSYDLEMVLACYGYVQRGRRWLSPNSDTGSPGVTVTDDGKKWMSTHGSDSAIGMATANGTMGDAFDLFVHYEHHGDRDAATRAAGEMFGCRRDQQPDTEYPPAMDSRVQATETPVNKKRRRAAARLVQASNIKPEAIKWIWNGWLAAGKIHILAGIAGHGKSTILFTIAATISIGGRWPDGTKAPIGDVVIWSGEDDAADTIVPRLIASGADLSHIHILQGVNEGGEKRNFDPATDIPLLREAIKGKNIKLLIVDPIVSAVAGDSHKNAEVRRSLQPLVDMAVEADCAVYGVTHFTKGTAGAEPVERVTSSLAFGALTRMITVAMKLPEQGDHPKGARLFARAKSNIGPDGGGFYYFIDVGPIPDHPDIINTRVLWGDAVNGTAKEMLAKAEMPGDGQGVTNDAIEWLKEALSDGPIESSSILKAGKDQGYSKSTLHRAKNRLGIKSTKVGFAKGWGWYLPEKVDQDTNQGSIQLETGSSDKKNTQTLDIHEGSTKVPSLKNSRSDGIFEGPKIHEDPKGLGPSDDPLTGKGLEGVEPPKIPSSRVWGSSDQVGIFDDNEKDHDSAPWEAEI